MQIILFKDTVIAHLEAMHFVKQNRLWEGFWKYGWVSRLLVFLAVAIGIKFFFILKNMAFPSDPGIVTTAMTLGSVFQNFAVEGYEFLFSGIMKYLMLIMLEVIIFHMCRLTLKILSGADSDLSLDNFVKAQIRMIKVAIRAFITEMFFTMIVKILFGIFGSLDFLQPIIIYLVQCYFLGILVLDNYIEQFGYSIKESFKIIRQYAGIALGIGLILNVLLAVPLLGPLAGPVLAAVTATIVMYDLFDVNDFQFKSRY